MVVSTPCEVSERAAIDDGALGRGPYPGKRSTPEFGQVDRWSSGVLHTRFGWDGFTGGGVGAVGVEHLGLVQGIQEAVVQSPPPYLFERDIRSAGLGVGGVGGEGAQDQGGLGPRGHGLVQTFHHDGVFDVEGLITKGDRRGHRVSGVQGEDVSFTRKVEEEEAKQGARG